MKLKVGLILSGLYVALCVFLIGTQGLFGESFIVLTLGLPWSLLFSYFEYGGVGGPMLIALVFLPIVLNAVLLYYIGSLFDRKTPQPPQS